MIEAGSGTVAATMFTVPDVLVNGVAESSVPLLKPKLSKKCGTERVRGTHPGAI
jgi:hypothetical protein